MSLLYEAGQKRTMAGRVKGAALANDNAPASNAQSIRSMAALCGFCLVTVVALAVTTGFCLWKLDQSRRAQEQMEREIRSLNGELESLKFQIEFQAPSPRGSR